MENRTIEKRQTMGAGWLLIATGFLTITLMSQHPSGGDGGVMISLVHGGLQVVMLVQLAAFLMVGRTFGWSVPLVIGTLFFAAGQAAGIGAATINGFVVPTLNAYPAGAIGSDIGRFAWEANQALARLGVVAVGIGFALWSVCLWQARQRRLAVAGWIAGLVPALLLASDHIGMDLHGALFAYLMQALWLMALGWSVIRRA